MKKYLRCVNTDVKPNGGVTLGQRYEVIGESDSAYCIDGFGHYTKEPDSDGRSYRTWFVLETEGGESMENVIEIDGVKYREVKRKAAVGEKIKVTQGFGSGGDYRNGDVLVVSHDTGFGNSAHAVRAVDIACGIYDSEYVVLEPVTGNITASDVDLIVLQRELNGLKRQQAELTKQIDGLTDAFAKLALSPAKTVAPKPKSRQAQRDEIVAQAKRDVAELQAEGRGGKHYSTGYIVDFVVNRDKRTVVALLREPLYSTVIARGIAKAAPGDVFNSHIGRAISLRRALGLPVPTEYTNAPQPTEPRVGDVVCSSDEFHQSIGSKYVPLRKTTLTSRRPERDGVVLYGIDCGIAWNHTADGGWIGDKQFVTIDDSREGIESEVSA